MGRLPRSSRTLTTKRPRKLYSALKGILFWVMQSISQENCILFASLEQRDLFGKVLEVEDKRFQNFHPVYTVQNY